LRRLGERTIDAGDRIAYVASKHRLGGLEMREAIGAGARDGEAETVLQCHV